MVKLYRSRIDTMRIVVCASAWGWWGVCVRGGGETFSFRSVSVHPSARPTTDAFVPHPPQKNKDKKHTYRVVQRLVEVVSQRPQKVPQALGPGGHPRMRPSTRPGAHAAVAPGGQGGGRGELGPGVRLVGHADETKHGGDGEDDGGHQGREARGDPEEVPAEGGPHDPGDGDGRLCGCRGGCGLGWGLVVGPCI